MGVARHSRLEPHANPIAGLDQHDRHNSPPENPRFWPVISEIAGKLAINRDAVRENDGGTRRFHGKQEKIQAQTSTLRYSPTHG